MKNKDYLEKILEFCSFISFTLLVINVTAQIITRNFMPNVTLAWTEEASRFLFVYTIAFAAPLAMKKKEYVNVDLFLNMLSTKVRKIAQLILDIISIGLFALVGYQGFLFAQKGIGQTSPALRLPMWLMYGTIPLMCSLIVVYGVYNLIKDIRNWDNKEEIEDINMGVNE